MVAPVALVMAETYDPRVRRRKNRSSSRIPRISEISKRQGHPNSHSLHRRKWSMKDIRHAPVCPSLLFLPPCVLIGFSWDTRWPENSKFLTFDFRSTPVIIPKEAQRFARYLRNGLEEGQKLWWDQHAEGGGTEQTRGGRVEETAKASTESPKCNLCKPQDIIFFRHHPHNKSYFDRCVPGFSVEPALILDRHFR
jgi:hypothetical protein